MSVAAMPLSRVRGLPARLFRSTALVWTLDGLFAVVLGVVFRGSTFARVWQGVASVLVGKGALEGGATMVVLGLLMHLTVAFTWSLVFMVVVRRSPWLRGVLDSPYGAVKVGAVYGPFIWLVMSLVVIPVLVHRPPSITVWYVVQLIGHIPFVGVPIAAMIGTPSRR